MMLYSAFTPVPPLHSYRSSAAEAPRSRDSSGYGLALDRSGDTSLCFHASNSLFCILLCCPLSIFSTVVCSASPAHFKMPKVCSRMCSRRGGSRGRVTRQPSSTTSDPSSNASDFFFDRYPVTRSGRSRGRGSLLTELRPHHSQTHTARFHFPYTLSSSSFIVSVIVELCEDSVGLGAVNPGDPLEPRPEDKNKNSLFANKQRKDPGDSATQDTTIHVGPSVPAGGGSPSNKGHHFETEDLYQFGCRIVKESPPTSHED